MKKLLPLILSAFAAVFMLAACAPQPEENAVTLVDVTAQEVGIRTGIDYFVVAEPAASVKVNALEGLEFSGDLQALYGGQNGYPQAVVVMKNELTVYGAASAFISELSASRGWLLSESTSVATVVSAVQSHVEAGATPTFNEKNLSKKVIENCGVNFLGAAEQREEINSFMQKLNGVSATSFGTPSDGFFYDGGAAEKPEYTGDISVYMPDGAPALGMAKLMVDEDFYNGKVTFNVVNASTIQTFVTGANPKADVCVLPVNAAVKLLGGGEKYKLLGTLTHGNLYLVSKGEMSVTPDNISLLKGKTVGVVNLSQIPGLTLKLILQNGGIPFTEQH